MRSVDLGTTHALKTRVVFGKGANQRDVRSLRQRQQVAMIFGIQSPCGKLAETMPKKNVDILAHHYFPGTRDVVEYREGLDVGYRYFDTVQKPVRFPFGHGLSYTSFEYSNLNVKVTKDDTREKEVIVSFTVQNIGRMAGQEVAQCYVKDIEASVYRPAHELKDYCKVLLQPGQKKIIEFRLGQDAFAFYDIGAKDWAVEPGFFEVQIGASSRDLRLKESLEFKQGQAVSNLSKESYPPRMDSLLSEIDDATFASRFGNRRDEVLRGIDARKNKQNEQHFHRNTLLKDVAKHRLVGYILFLVTFFFASKDLQPGDDERKQKKLIKENVDHLPLRAVALFGKGAISLEALDALIDIMNYHWLSAIMRLIFAPLNSLHLLTRRLWPTQTSYDQTPMNAGMQSTATRQASKTKTS